MSEPTHEEVLQFVYKHPKPFVATSDVSERFESVSKRTINKRLNDLWERGELQKDEIGARAVVYYPPVESVEEAKRSSPSSEIQ